MPVIKIVSRGGVLEAFKNTPATHKSAKADSKTKHNYLKENIHSDFISALLSNSAQ